MAKKGNISKRERERLLLRAEAVVEKRRRMARSDFWAFCLWMDYDFFSRRAVLKEVAGAFGRVHEAYARGETRRLAVSMPPRGGKSYLTSLFVAFMVGNFPEESVMRNTCSSPLYEKLSYDTRDIVRSARYSEVFPDIRLKADQQRVSGWSVEGARQVTYFGAGVGGTVIGFGASMLAITDDLYKNLEDALSEGANEKTWSWKQGTHDSRLEGACCVLDIGTRWSGNDVLGRCEQLRDGTYYDEIIRIPALDENGLSFCEDVHTTEYYHQLRAETDEGIWMAEYMQEPFEAKGLLYPHKELKRFRLSDLKGRTPDGVIGAVDVADTGADNLCAPIAKVFGGELYVTDVVFTKEAVEVSAPLLAGVICQTRADRIRIESNGGGRIYAGEVKRLVAQQGGRAVIDTRTTTSNKETRILMKSGWVKAHVHFLAEGEYPVGGDYARFMKALCGYKKEGGNKHDDAPDGVTMLAEFFTLLDGNVGAKVKRVARGSGRAL